MNLIKIIKFDLMNIARNPMLLIMNISAPLLLFGGFGLVTYNNFSGESVSVWDYYVVRIMIFSGIAISMSVTNTFMEASVIKGNLRAAYTPASKTEILIAKVISTYIFATIVFNSISILTIPALNVNFGRKNTIFVLIIINLLALFGCCMGTLICTIMKSEESANSIVSIIIMLFVALGGVFSQPGHFNKIMQVLSNFSPISWVTKCVFQIIYDSDFTLYFPTMLILLATSAFCILISHILFRLEDFL